MKLLRDRKYRILFAKFKLYTFFEVGKKTSLNFDLCKATWNILYNKNTSQVR